MNQIPQTAIAPEHFMGPFLELPHLKTQEFHLTKTGKVGSQVFTFSGQEEVAIDSGCKMFLRAG